MATDELTETHMAAAKEFSKSLSDIGFDMDGVFWAYDKEDERHVLIVVTDVFDAKGPLEISRQIFKAYNASLTPKEIDPFIVRLLSTNQVDARELLGMASSDWTVKHYKKGTSEFSIRKNIANGNTLELEEFTVSDVTIRPEWVVMIKAHHKVRKTHEINRKWDFFKRNLDKLAA